MSAIICSCPLSAALEEIVLQVCPQNFGQASRAVIQRKKDGSGNRNEIDIATNNPNLQATWDALKAATDSTKAVLSPIFTNPETDPGDFTTFGGGNATLGGAEIIVNRNATPFTAEIHSVRQDAIRKLKKIQCEDVQLYLIDHQGVLGAETDDLDTPTKYRGLPVVLNTFFVSDLDLGGLEEPDRNYLQWSFNANWSDYFHLVSPVDFNALEDL